MSRTIHALFVSRDNDAIPPFLAADETLVVTATPAGVSALREFERAKADVVVLDANGSLESLLQIFYSFRSLGEVWPTPVAALLRPGQSQFVLPALEAGIDECVSATLDPQEIVARIRSLGRRSKLVATSEKIYFSDLVLDPVNIKLWRRGRLIPLPVLQFRLLEFLVAHPGRVFDRGQLKDHVWPGDRIDEATVTQCIARLRRALTSAGEADLVRSVRGVGYSLEEGAAG